MCALVGDGVGRSERHAESGTLSGVGVSVSGQIRRVRALYEGCASYYQGEISKSGFLLAVQSSAAFSGPRRFEYGLLSRKARMHMELHMEHSPSYQVCL